MNKKKFYNFSTLKWEMGMRNG